MKDLYEELESAEKVIKKSIYFLIESGKLDPSFRNLEIYVQIESGSILEKFKVVFTGAMLAQAAVELVVGVVRDTYNYYLDSDANTDSAYVQEIAMAAEDDEYKKSLSRVLSPLTESGDQIIINENHGTINVSINYDDSGELQGKLLNTNQDPLAKNGQFEESLMGVIRKLDLDASSGNYFGFTIDNGRAKVPASIRGDFNLSEVKEILDVHIQINAMVRYKDDEVIHIEIINYSVLDRQDGLSI